MLSREHHGPRAILHAVERLANGYAPECARLRQELAVAQSQLRDYQARLDKPFPHDAVLSELTAVRDRLKACLSGAAAEPGPEPQGSIPQLVERSNALSAASTAETLPDRVGRSHFSAEEPVTARIRRRMTAAFVSEGHGTDVRPSP